MEFFEGKKAVVTGAARGIGFGIASALYKHKANVIAIDHNEKGLLDLQEKFPLMETIWLNLSDWDETRTTFEGISDIDMVVNNAATTRLVPFLDTSKEDIDELFDLNFMSIVNIMQVVGKSMKERGKGGSIVNISSVLSGKLEMTGRSIYSATKAAVQRISAAAAFELGQYNIRVNSVHPSTTKTPRALPDLENPEIAGPMLERTPNGRFCEIDDIVGPVLFLLNDNLSAMVQGEALMVDGGLN